MDAWNTTFLFEAMFGCICQAARRKKLAVVDETSNLLVCERRFPGRFPHVWPNIRRWFISTSIFFLKQPAISWQKRGIGVGGPTKKNTEAGKWETHFEWESKLMQILWLELLMNLHPKRRCMELWAARLSSWKNACCLCVRDVEA